MTSYEIYRIPETMRLLLFMTAAILIFLRRPMISAIARFAWSDTGFSLMEGGYFRLLLHPYRGRR